MSDYLKDGITRKDICIKGTVKDLGNGYYQAIDTKGNLVQINEHDSSYRVIKSKEEIEKDKVYNDFLKGDLKYEN